ncbi:hypothetical protein DFH08DRAFT_1051622 [Mycena albidolilacea]|uniref:Novel STAND NTPase 1 domain-containing protein n=1 Tax=Mycena albidolilacea TaxID=1033008 RepID=A0AAD6Z5S6_9AGAR|nr:hypothetical protein DFH08DRAFT_1051622 [Mycena albidolilacea]
MPTRPTDTKVRLNTLITCFTIMVETLEILANSLQADFLQAIANTTRSLLKNIETVKKNKRTCTELMEETHELLNAIIILHINSDTGGVLPPSTLNHIGKFTKTLHKIHTFVEAHQSSSKIKQFFRQGEMSTLLKDCKNGLTQGLGFFQLKNMGVLSDISKNEMVVKQRHQEVLAMIDGLSDSTSSARASMMSRVYSQSQNSSQSISILPSHPKIFHGRESEMLTILKLLGGETPRIAILGTGGMGKTSLARAVVHHPEISVKYAQHRYFVACDSAANKIELAALIGAHLGLKPGKDLTQAVSHYFTIGPSSLLVLDNLETVWEPIECRGDIEEFLSLLTDIQHLALVITMRGAERPAKVQWNHPFLLPLQPLKHYAAQQIFIDIAEDHHNPEEVDRVLSLTDNMPLAINLIAHLVDVEGCSSVLSRWEEEKTSLISDGYDKRSNLDLSISFSLSSPRIKAVPHSEELLSLLSMLPDGLSDVELSYSNLPIENILDCKTALIRTALAYQDEKKRLKALVPIREYMKKSYQPGHNLIQPLVEYFKELLELYGNLNSSQMSSSAAQILSNLANIQNILQNGLQPNYPDIKDIVLCALHLNLFSRLMGRGDISFLTQLHHVLPDPCDHQLEAALITELIASSHSSTISNPETVIAQALEHFEHFDDPDLKCRLNFHTLHMKTDFSGFKLGNYLPARLHACEAQRLARISADLYMEAHALRIEAMAWTLLGNYKQSISLYPRARELLVLCGMSGGSADHSTMNNQAQIHSLKSEYHEAQNIHTQILQECPVHMDPFHHGLALLNLAEIMQQDIERAKKIFHSMERTQEITMCDTIVADLYLREGDVSIAKTLFKTCLRACNHSEIKSYCLERLGNTGRWGAYGQMSSWTTVYLAHSMEFKEKLGIYKALQFLGDIFLAQTDEATAVSLFIVALGGLTYMDIHRSRAECMLRLGDISKGHDDLHKAVEFWDSARSLFERSSQTKHIELIDERLASIGKDVLEQHRMNLAHLVEINAPTGIAEEMEDDLSDTEDLQEDLGGVPSLVAWQTWDEVPYLTINCQVWLNSLIQKKIIHGARMTRGKSGWESARRAETNRNVSAEDFEFLAPQSQEQFAELSPNRKVEATAPDEGDFEADPRFLRKIANGKESEIPRQQRLRIPILRLRSNPGTSSLMGENLSGVTLSLTWALTAHLVPLYSIDLGSVQQSWFEHSQVSA